MNVDEFDFELPDELIAQEPPAERGQSRLLVLRRDPWRRSLVDATFGALLEYLERGDLLVLNDTRVFPARLLGRRVPTGGAVECLLLRELPTPNSQFPTERRSVLGGWELGVGGSSAWEALVHPGQKLHPGARMLFEGPDAQIHGEIEGHHFHGRRSVRVWTDDGTSVTAAIDRIGHIPLPPYIKRDDTPSDRDRYQTVYARQRGSIAAPTAGLHFTGDLLNALPARGIEQVQITLHVGYGTFKPVRADRVEDHIVDPEIYVVSEAAAGAMTRARREGRRIIAVGTTTTRALESLTIDDEGAIQASSGETRLFIYPGHEFRVVDGMITNFHLPRSSLLMLVAAFAGRDRILNAYRAAIERAYRFYSYGDAMLIY